MRQVESEIPSRDYQQATELTKLQTMLQVKYFSELGFSGRGSQQATQNAQAGVNLLQTAEGDLGIIQDNLQRIRDLAVQAANDTNGSNERVLYRLKLHSVFQKLTESLKLPI